MVTYTINKGDNPNYWMLIECPGHNLEILADMPEQIQIGAQSDWESRMPFSLAGLLEKAFGQVAQGISTLVGVDPQVQSLSFQMWMGTSPIEFPVTLLFDAEESPQRDVFEPITYLMSIMLPNNGSGGLLWPPGPRWGPSDNSRGYGVNIKIGKMMQFIDCIVVNATETFDSRMGDDGYPIAGQVEIVFRTSIVYGAQDWLKAMQLKPISDLEQAANPNGN